MHIRTASSADIPAILAMERDAASAAHWTAAQYANVFSQDSQRTCWVVEQGSALQAFLVARTLGAEWEIENIVVADTAQRRGLALLLMAKLMDDARAKAVDAIFLEVRASNTAARSLYAKCGFLETGRRKSYYFGPQE